VARRRGFVPPRIFADATPPADDPTGMLWRALTMANFTHRFIVSAALTAAVWLVVQLQPSPASAQQGCSEGCCEGL